MDFAKIVELFENHNVSFVSVTQHFNTKDSMGRLTLNILLSFAQFEREIISERIRDKIVASKRRGQWIGGLPILGFDTNYGGRGVSINEVEAQTVREIFDTYIENRSISKTIEVLNLKDVRNKQWRTRKGKVRGGQKFSKSTLARLLKNKKYIGKVDFDGKVYDGDFGYIVSEEIFRKAQEILENNNFEKCIPTKNKYNALLSGKLYCAHCGTLMGTQYTKKTPTKIYRYYICCHAQKYGWKTCPHPSLPADEIENYLVRELSEIANSTKLRNEVVESFYHNTLNQISDLGKRNTALSRSLIELRKKIKTEESISEHLFSLDDLRKQEVQIIDSISLNESIIKELTNKADIKRQELEELLGNFDNIWNNLSFIERKYLFNTLIEKVVFDGRSGKIAITFTETFKDIQK